ncbi:hypothetical protein FRC00_001719 [Tulasnella sp. 408]|nr:hypothetical protein FRC00_001719 [Tulasnella sp. 408]
MPSSRTNLAAQRTVARSSTSPYPPQYSQVAESAPQEDTKLPVVGEPDFDSALLVADAQTQTLPVESEPEFAHHAKYLQAPDPIQASASPIVPDTDSVPPASPGGTSVHASLGYELQGELTRGKRHSVGSLVDVYRGTWVKPEGGEVQIAIKVLRAFAPRADEGASDRRQARLLRQCSLWHTMSHPNILPFLGYRLGEDPCIILPWCNNGNISKYLSDHPEIQRPEKILLLHQAALGLQHLHTRVPPVVHGNICPENVLINDFKAAVLSDFDLSRAIEEKTGFTTTGAGGQANRYLAPEAFMADSSSATFPTDIYAFGGLILTAMSGRPPHHHILGVGRYLLAVMGGAVPTPPDHPGLPEADSLWSLMSNCWASGPSDRPSIDKVVNFLDRETSEDAQGQPSSPAVQRIPLLTVDAAVDETGSLNDMADSDVQLLAELGGDLVPEKDPALEKTRQGGFADVEKSIRSYRLHFLDKGRKDISLLNLYVTEYKIFLGMSMPLDASSWRYSESVMSGHAPFYKLKPGKAILVTTAGSTPEPSAHPGLPPTDPLWNIMRKCWTEPSSRPLMKDVVLLVGIVIRSKEVKAMFIDFLKARGRSYP